MKCPLSFHQERLWLIDSFETGKVYSSSPTYHNIPLLLRGRGKISAEKLGEALRLLAGRHAALRTRVVAETDGPVQVIEPYLAVAVPVRDLGEKADAAAALAAAVAEATRPFALQADALLRAALLRYGTDSFLAVITLHHLVADRPSLRILARELGQIMGGSAPSDPELQYADFAHWQRSLSAEALEPLLFYWKWQLRGRLSALELPAARPRPAVLTFTAAWLAFTWDPGLGRALRDFAARERAEPESVTLAAFKVLLHRYARQDEIVVGASEPGRHQPGADRLVGPVANLVVLRSQLGGNPSFRAVLAEVDRGRRQAREHQAMPFGPLVLALRPEMDMSRTALFDVLFGHDEEPAPEIGLGEGVTARLIDTNLGYGKYDLNLSLQAERGGGLAGALVYNADLHDADFMAQMMRHLGRLLRAALADPTAGIDDLPLLDAAEERRQLVDWNDTAAGAPRERTLPELFAAQAARTPDRIALSHGAEGVTYAALEARANRLAHHLQAQGVGPEALVAVCLDRSIDLVMALLAVLKAGGAYLPLDPSYPRERLAFTVRDAQVAHLVTTAALAGVIAEPVAQRTLLDADAAAIAGRPDAAPALAVRPEHLAYCIYTSGSTGQPKGALLEHRQVVRLMRNDRMPFTFGETDVWTLFHSCCFDFSVWEMYGALLYGARLVIVPQEVARDPALFVALVVREGVTILNQTPTSFYNFAAEALRTGAPLALRTVIFGGEALLPLHLRAFRAAYPGVALVNMYGITETTVHVTVAEVDEGDIAANRSNIGRPIPTTTTVLLDRKLRLVPAGVPGEICVGGEGVGRGYLRRDALTRERFIDDPYRPGERLYRSGDLARHLPDGRMIYLGRIDDQVQIRGFRVELGEIKTRLLQHPAVAGVEVIARPLAGEALELVAYLMLRGQAATVNTGAISRDYASVVDAGINSSGLTPSVAELRRHLAATLPDYMVPAAFVLLPALPLTANGKVDRRALPEPAGQAAAAGRDYVAPRNPAEEKLAALWAEVLRRDRVGVRDSFFELGGHSLLATQLMSRVRDAFDVELPLRHLFEAPTVEAFAPIVAARAAAGAPPPQAAPIGKAARRLRNAAAAH